MTTKNALILEDTYLHSEDATGLEDMIVQVSDDTVDITVRGRAFAISLDAADLAAIQRLVTEAQPRLTHRYYFDPATQPASTVLVNSMPTSNLTKGIMELRNEEQEKLWQPTWATIDSDYRYVVVTKKSIAFAASAAPSEPNLRLGEWRWQGDVQIECLGLVPLSAQQVQEWETLIFKRPWQPDWTNIPLEVKFVTRDKKLEGAWGWSSRPIKELKGFWHSGLGFKLFNVVIPDDVDWEILHERPAEIIFHKHPDDWRLDWSQVPSPYKYVCKDQGGKVFGYVHAPIRDSICWIAQIEDQTFNGCVELSRDLIADHIAWQIIHMRTADPEPSEPIPWQPDWTRVNWRVKFICKDANQKAWGYPSRPRLGTSMWSVPGGGWRMAELDNQVPGDWREILLERPE